jgi:hypothetical protein
MIAAQREIQIRQPAGALYRLYLNHLSIAKQLFTLHAKLHFPSRAVPPHNLIPVACNTDRIADIAYFLSQMYQF